jgi:hypothetical protein
MGTDARTDADRLRTARERGAERSLEASAVIAATFDKDADAVRLVFRGGGSMSIPRHAVPGLKGRAASSLAGITVSPAGDAISWRDLDIDVYLPGLVERTFGTRLFAAAAGRRGGRTRSKAKSAAARSNGAMGGRPRKARRR